jgi:hypothetical protein
MSAVRQLVSVGQSKAAEEVDWASLLRDWGRLYSEVLGIDLNRLDPTELFKWFLASLLFGARINESIAIRTYAAFRDHRLLSVESVAQADFGELLQIMGEGGYARYDGVTSRKVHGATRRLIDQFGGDLNRLHASAAGPRELEARLLEFKGVGPITAQIFLRDLRGVWERADPTPGAFAELASAHLGIGDLRQFWATHAVPGFDFRHFETALTRMGKRYCHRGRCADAPIPH